MDFNRSVPGKCEQQETWSIPELLCLLRQELEGRQDAAKEPKLTRPPLPAPDAESARKPGSVRVPQRAPNRTANSAFLRLFRQLYGIWFEAINAYFTCMLAWLPFVAKVMESATGATARKQSHPGNFTRIHPPWLIVSSYSAMGASLAILSKGPQIYRCFASKPTPSPHPDSRRVAPAPS